VFALGADGAVEDVTRNYTTHWLEVLARRREKCVDENWLAREVMRIAARPVPTAPAEGSEKVRELPAARRARRSVQ
jgi:hypothetical protein